MDWDKLRIFHVVAESGSFTRASESLGLSQSAVSRQMQALEESLRVALFHRHARGLVLTEQGEQLHRATRELAAKVAITESILAESKERATGHLRVTTTVSFGSMWLTAQIGEFLDAYPEITVSLLVADIELDLGMRKADVAIWMGPPRQSDLIQRHLFTGHFGVYCAPSYINRFGTPGDLADLGKHRVISYGELLPMPFPGINFLVDALRVVEPGYQPALTINNVYGMTRAVESGVGIGGLPNFLVEERRQLVRVLPELKTPSVDAYFVYPAELRESRRVTVFRDFLLRRITATSF